MSSEKENPFTLRNILWNVFVQILPMALGVYLGFLATDISEDRKRAELKRNFAASMLNEISVNEAGISSRIDYHRMLRDSTRSLLRNFNIKTISISFFQGIRMRDLTDGAYLTGIQTGAISEFEISDIQLINQVYTSQKGYNSLLSMTLNNLLGMDFAYDEAHLKRVLNFLTMVMADVVIQEEKLLMEYKELRTLLEKNSPDLSAGTNTSKPDSLNSVR